MMPKPHFFTDGKGKRLGVYFPINEWKAIEKRYPELAIVDDSFPSKAEILTSLRQAVSELNEVNKGALKSKSAKELLDEL